MKKFLMTLLLFAFAFVVKAQYNNEWIDYNKTYYKIHVGISGLVRVNQTVLESAGLGNVPAQDFQAFHNGREVPLYTSKASGLLTAGDFIEFMGEINDGSLDDGLYANPTERVSSRYSVQTDTSAYFLTVNPGGANQRMVDQANIVAGNTLPATPYFMHTFVSAQTKVRLNPGRAAVVGEYVYSSTYEPGEGWTSGDIAPARAFAENRNNLFVYTGGPDNVTFRVSAGGNAQNQRSWQVYINGNKVVDEQMNFFQTSVKEMNIPLAYIGKTVDTFRIVNSSTVPTDRMSIGKIEMVYPRQFNFGSVAFFDFHLPGNTVGHYLDINAFNFPGTSTPILYDITNNKRYTAVKSASRLRFVLPPSGDRRLVMLNTAGPSLTDVSHLKEIKFQDYSKKQGDFIIISNPMLYNGTNGNPVEAYRSFRTSPQGGSFNAQIYDIDQLVDQFAYGVKMHPLSVKNFIRFARQTFTVKPKFIFLIGRGLTYDQYRTQQAKPITDRMQMVPTFGSPASDNLLASDDLDPIPETPIGRLAVCFPDEIEHYLNKVKEHEEVLKTGSQTFADRGWLKNVVHAIGGSDPFLQSVIYGYMNAAAKVIEDTAFGGKVYSFSKNSAYSVQQLTSQQLKELFEKGINLLTYFGHSSANTLEFNLDDPNIYNNQGKYPMFVVNGCNAGNFFVYDTLRVTANALTLSEKYVLADKRGCIGFMASTHYGIVAYLNIFTYGLYEAISSQYTLPISQLQIEASKKLLSITGSTDFFGKMHAEEVLLHGDPAIRLYPQPAPDYIIEESFIKFDPAFISVADKEFTTDIRMYNIGKAVTDSILVDIKRQLPNGTQTVVFHSKIPGIRYMDSILLKLQINPLTDKGENKLIITVDADDAVAEISESNNVYTKSFYIIEEEARPISPINLGIVGTSNVTFYASVANPLSAPRNYIMEIDTTELFNSSWKKSQTINSPGGLLQFDIAGLNFSDSTVYYWRTSPVPLTGDVYVWNSSSFVYLPNAGQGFNQSHYFQHKKDEFSDIRLEDDRAFRYGTVNARLTIKNGLDPYYGAFQVGVTLNTDIFTNYGCTLHSLQIFVYDSLTLEPWKNTLQPDGSGRFGSIPPCIHNSLCFEFPYFDSSYRRKAMAFLESIPKGYFVSITNFGKNSNTRFISEWMSDTLRLGSGRSLYHTLKNMGFTDIDGFTHNVPFIFFQKKGVPSYPIYSKIGNKESDFLEANFDLSIRLNYGQISSPWFGPAIRWDRLKIDARNIEAEKDSVGYILYGKDNAGNETILTDLHSTTDTSIQFVDAQMFPYLRIQMRNRDTINGTPQQIKYWRVFAQLPPEGALIPLPGITNKDTIELGEAMNFRVAFKNISPTPFDSLLVKMTVTDKNNLTHPIEIPRRKPLLPNDTIVISHSFDTKDLSEYNTLFLNVNPDFDQPEQFLFNNFVFKAFYVKPDSYHPTLDVTFDGVHILNRDIVSAKPKIMVKLKDNSKFLALNDTSLLKVKVKYPNGDERSFRFDNDTLRFTPADLSGGKDDNTATIDFGPYFPEDGEYELIVTGKDKSGNTTGFTDYRVVFAVINKPMISNLLNYPNPFTTSTAFVFTVTGTEPPQNLRIQILTITGKIVREITKEELGPIHVGRNITEFKWDGTDQYGQKLANGVYLYRVLTNLNGKSLDKYKAEGDKTDQYFRAGYGKMYLMR